MPRQLGLEGALQELSHPIGIPAASWLRPYRIPKLLERAAALEGQRKLFRSGYVRRGLEC